MFLPPTDKQNCGEGTTKHSVAYRARICTQLLQVEKIHLRLAVIAPHYRAEERGYVTDSDCNPGIPAVFANPEYRDWQRPNPWISGLQKNGSVPIPGFRDYKSSLKSHFFELQRTKIAILEYRLWPVATIWLGMNCLSSLFTYNSSR